MNIVPIIIPCFNNYKYVQNTLDQLEKINPLYRSWVLIMDNASDDADTKEFLSKVNVQVIRNPVNTGPWINTSHNVHIFNALPEYYILTDPDLQLNPNLPSNFIEHMMKLCNQFNAIHVGFALDISEPEKMFPNSLGVKHNKECTVAEWEAEFWKNKEQVTIDSYTYEFYRAPIDTTFVLRKKSGTPGIEFRMGGDFTAKHIPWYIQNPFYSTYEIAKSVKNRISTTGLMVREYIQKHCVVVKKNNEEFIFENTPTDVNLGFWTNVYGTWEKETFEVFDHFLKSEKIFIDIGGWIGTTCMYGARKSKHVYVVEADPLSVVDLKKNINLNATNITVVSNAIYNKDDEELVFGQNRNLPNSKMNESTSQLHPDATDGIKVKTMRVSSLISKYGIDPQNISLIKVDIEGGEEYIMDDLFELKQKYNIPMYISFHFQWWKNYNIHRFHWLPLALRFKIMQDPFCSILF
jgi:FkbM family methyltransferase